MDKVLSYYDVLLRSEDVELLSEGQWLNDQVRLCTQASLDTL